MSKLLYRMLSVVIVPGYPIMFKKCEKLVLVLFESSPEGFSGLAFTVLFEKIILPYPKELK